MFSYNRNHLDQIFFGSFFDKCWHKEMRIKQLHWQQLQWKTQFLSLQLFVCLLWIQKYVGLTYHWHGHIPDIFDWLWKAVFRCPVGYELTRTIGSGHALEWFEVNFNIVVHFNMCFSCSDSTVTGLSPVKYVKRLEDSPWKAHVALKP